MKIKSFLALLLCIPLLLVACSPLSNASDNMKTRPAVPDGSDPGPPYVLKTLTEFHENVEAHPNLLKVGYPSVEDPSIAEDFSFHHYDGLHWYILNYTIDGVWYSFSYTGYDRKTDTSLRIPCTTAEVCGRTLQFYPSENKISGVFYIGDYKIQVDVRNYGQIDNVDFSHFTWISTSETEP